MTNTCIHRSLDGSKVKYCRDFPLSQRIPCSSEIFPYCPYFCLHYITWTYHPTLSIQGVFFQEPHGQTIIFLMAAGSRVHLPVSQGVETHVIEMPHSLIFHHFQTGQQQHLLGSTQNLLWHELKSVRVLDFL